VELIARQSSAARREALQAQGGRRRRTGSGRDARTVKHLLEELYGDWKYLEQVLNDEGECHLGDLDKFSYKSNHRHHPLTQ